MICLNDSKCILGSFIASFFVEALLGATFLLGARVLLGALTETPPSALWGARALLGARALTGTPPSALWGARALLLTETRTFTRRVWHLCKQM